ncbi:MAG: hypothetical protein J6K52_04650 [Clostridia bacterium]|nr:hypothetical protein [Clostridia bacterium]MBQ7788074.1 hypothetical protein [Clostridia bacterium]
MKIYLDRIDFNHKGEKIAVFECNEKMIAFHQNNMPEGFIDKLTMGIIVEAEIKDGVLINPKLLIEETNERLTKNRMRLERLRNRNKNK